MPIDPKIARAPKARPLFQRVLPWLMLVLLLPPGLYLAHGFWIAGPRNNFERATAEAFAMAINLGSGQMALREGNLMALNSAPDQTCQGGNKPLAECLRVFTTHSLILDISATLLDSCPSHAGIKWPAGCTGLSVDEYYLENPAALQTLIKNVRHPCEILEANAIQADAASRSLLNKHATALGCSNANGLSVTVMNLYFDRYQFQYEAPFWISVQPERRPSPQ